MTLTLAPRQSPDQESEALIREARRLQRRRWRLRAALIIAMVLVAAGLIIAGREAELPDHAQRPAFPTCRRKEG